MTDDARNRESKWDAKEGSPDVVEILKQRSPEVVEISEDDSLPMDMDNYCKDAVLIPARDSTNSNVKQLDECSNLRPDASMHGDSSDAEHKLTYNLNKDNNERQFKASTERSGSPGMIDEDCNNNDWSKSGWDKTTGNQSMSRYAGANRQAEGCGTSFNRGHSSRMSSDLDAWKQRSPSPRGGWNRLRRNRSRSRSRSRSRGRGRGRSRSRSRSPYFVDRGSERRVERGRAFGGSAPPCRDFAVGRCRRGAQCRFPHEDGGRRQFGEHYRADSRERYGHHGKENLMGSREQNDYSRNRHSRGHYDEGTWERSELRRDDRSSEQCHDFIKGRCSRGVNCRYAHDDSASHGGWRDDARESVHGRGGTDSSYRSRTEHRRVDKNPCKFFAEGRCRRGQNCPYFHDAAAQSHVELGAPDEPWNYRDGRTTTLKGNYSNWGEQANVTRASSQNSSRNDREKPASHSTGGGDSDHENKVQHVNDPGRSQYQIFPEEDFGSLGQSNTEGQSVPAATGNLSSHTGINNANLIPGQNLGLIAHGHNEISRIPASPIPPITTPSQSVNYAVLPDRHGQFVVPQAAANISASNVQGHPDIPDIDLNSQGYSLVAHGFPNIPAHNGQKSTVSGHVMQNPPMPVLAGQSQAISSIPNESKDGSTRSILHTHSVQSVTPNMQVRNQIPQGLSALPTSRSADMIGAPLSHKTGTAEEAARRITDLSASLAQYFGNAALNTGSVGLQSSQPKLNSSLSAALSAAPPAVQPNQWPWTQQQGNIVPAVHSSAPIGKQVLPTLQVPTAVGDNTGDPVLFSQPVAPSGHNSTLLIEDFTPTESKKEEAVVAEDKDADATIDGENKKNKESKALKMFKCALVDFVKDALKPTWKEGQLSREAHKTIVKKVVDKVTGALEGSTIPQTKEKIDTYLSYSREKLNKLVQAYVEKYVKT